MRRLEQAQICPDGSSGPEWGSEMGPDALRKPYYSKGASPLSWAVAVIAPIVAIAVSAASVGASVLPFLVVSCVAGIVFGTHVFYYLSPNWAKVALAVVFFGGMAALSLLESRWLGGECRWDFSVR